MTASNQPKVLLIFPPTHYRNHTPPLNLAYLCACLRRAGCSVKVIDAAAVKVDLSIDEITCLARDYQPDLIGITMNALFILPAYDLARRLRAIGVPIIAGGPHPSILPDEALENGSHIVVRNEGELTVMELIEWLRGNRRLEEIAGISFMKDGVAKHNPPRALIDDLDSLPFPDKDIFERADYIEDSELYQCYGTIFSSRGCPHNCTYCNKSVFGRVVRARSPENVLEEMLYLRRNYDVTAFEFLDDTFSLRLDRVDKICDMILAEPELKGICWQCTTRMDLTSDELLQKMRQAGCFRLFYGMESGDQETLKRVNKRLNIEKAVQVLKWTHDLKMRSIVAFMFGFPWETTKHVSNTYSLLRRISPYVDEYNPLGMLVPVPGTPMYEQYHREYGFTDWWLMPSFGIRYRSNQYFPYFRRRFFNDFALLEDGFFSYPPAVKREIKRCLRFIGKHNIYKNNPRIKAHTIYCFVLISKVLYRVHPKLEQLVFFILGRIKKIIFNYSFRITRN